MVEKWCYQNDLDVGVASSVVANVQISDENNKGQNVVFQEKI